MGVVGFAEIEITVCDIEQAELTGSDPVEVPAKAMVRKTDIESIHQTTRKGTTDLIVTVITMKSGSEFATYEPYESCVNRLLPKA